MSVRHGSPLALSIAGALLAAVACGPPQRSGQSATITIDSSGAYPIIRSEGVAFRWTAERVATLGSDSAGESTFGTVRSVLLDSSGAAYVLDPSNHQIHVFAPDGQLRAKWGRKGQGPGEFSMPYSIAWLGNSIAVMDPGIPRIMLLDAKGEWTSQWPYVRFTGGSTVRLYRSPPRGFWSYAGRPGPDGSYQTLFVRHTAAGPVDTVVVFRPAELDGQGARCDRPDRGISFFSPPYGPTPLVLPNAAGEQVVAISTAYRIAFMGPSHDTLRVIERPVTPDPVTDAEWDAELKEFSDFRKEWPTAHCSRTSWERVTTKPVLQSIFVDDEEQLWVEVLTVDGIVYDVFGAEGALRATVTGLPPSGGVDPSVVAGRIAIAVKDSLDVQSVQVFKLRR